MTDIERLREHLAHEARMNKELGKALLFDPQTMEFVVGCKKGTYTFPYDQSGDVGEFNSFVIPSGIDVEMSRGLVIRGFDFVLQSDVRKFIESSDGNNWKELRRSVIEVMHKVYTGLSEGIPINKLIGGFVGFDLVRMPDGNVIARVLGNAAGIGPDGNGSSVNPEYPQIYSFGNCDTPAQRLAALAGLGTVVWYAQKASLEKVDNSDNIVQGKLDLQ